MSLPRSAVALAICGLGLATLAVQRQAFAQNPAAAEALFEQARAAMAEGSFDIACARFRDSDRLDPAVGTRFNLADCEERRGRVATAWSLFRGVLSELSPDDDRRPIAEERAKALEPRIPQLTLQRTGDTPAGLRLRVDGVELGEGSLGVALPMDPGSHELSITVPGEAAPRVSSFTLTERQRAVLPIRIASVPPRSDGAPPAEAEGEADRAAAPAASAEPISRATWGYVAGGVGAAGIVLGTIAGVVALNKKSTADANCSDSRRVCNRAGVDANESGKTFAALSGVGFAVGAVGLGAGAYLLLTADQQASAHPSTPRKLARVTRYREAAVHSVNPSFVLGPSSGFVSLSGSF